MKRNSHSIYYICSNNFPSKLTVHSTYKSLAVNCWAVTKNKTIKTIISMEDADLFDTVDDAIQKFNDSSKELPAIINIDWLIQLNAQIFHDYEQAAFSYLSERGEVKAGYLINGIFYSQWTLGSSIQPLASNKVSSLAAARHRRLQRA